MVNSPTAAGAVSYGQGWASASNTPFRRFKYMLHEGGIAAPFIVHWPAGLKTQPGTINPTPSCITEIMPTFIDVAGASYPRERNGEAITPMTGRSLLPLFTGAALPPRVLYWEQYGFKAVRDGDLKAVFSVKEMYSHHGSGKWEPRAGRAGAAQESAAGCGIIRAHASPLKTSPTRRPRPHARLMITGSRRQSAARSPIPPPAYRTF